MPLQPRQSKQLHEALLQAFDKNGLSRLAKFELGQDLDAITKDAALTQRIFELINWAEQTGNTPALISGAYRQNPTNPAIIRLSTDSQDWQLDKVSDKVSNAPDAHIDKDTGSSNAKTEKSIKQVKDSFWVTLPGLLTAISGVIAALAACVVALNTVGLLPSLSARPTATVEVPAPSASVVVQPTSQPQPTALLAETATPMALPTATLSPMVATTQPSSSETAQTATAFVEPSPTQESTPTAAGTATDPTTLDAVALAKSLGLDPSSPELALAEKVRRAVALAQQYGVDTAMVRVDPIVGSAYVYVPEGPFTMGAVGPPDDQQPIKEIYLDAFAIKLNEVTNAEYQYCVDAGVCTPPENELWSQPAYADHPVTSVSWENADTYARWVGGRLPTEAEWEKACRSDDQRLYPWGATAPVQVHGNFGNLIGATQAVPSQSEDISPYGALDMAGSVREWVNDWYNRYYYFEMPARNPPGPKAARKHVIRGGAFNDRTLLTCVVRHSEHAETAPELANSGYRSNTVGFRVVLPSTK